MFLSFLTLAGESKRKQIMNELSRVKENRSVIPQNDFTLFHTVPYYTILYHTIPYQTILYYSKPHRSDTTRRHIILKHPISYHTIPYQTILNHTKPYHTIPYIPYQIIPHQTILYYNMPNYTTLYQTLNNFEIMPWNIEHDKAINLLVR